MLEDTFLTCSVSVKVYGCVTSHLDDTGLDCWQNTTAIRTAICWPKARHTDFLQPIFSMVIPRVFATGLVPLLRVCQMPKAINSFNMKTLSVGPQPIGNHSLHGKAGNHGGLSNGAAQSYTWSTNNGARDS